MLNNNNKIIDPSANPNFSHIIQSPPFQVGEEVLVYKDSVLGPGEKKGLGGECGQMREGKGSQGKQTHLISGLNSAPTHKSWMACEWRIREGGQSQGWEEVRVYTKLHCVSQSLSLRATAFPLEVMDTENSCLPRNDRSCSL